MSTPLRVLPFVEPYLELFAEGSDIFARAHRTKPEDVPLLAALCLRESWAGHAPGYRPKGSPDGTGDWSVRIEQWTRRSGVSVYPDSDGARDELRAKGWAIPKRHGVVVPGPYAIPLDGLGWGRGILQADILGDHRDLIAPAPWPVQRQAAAACAMLHLARQQLAALAAHPLYDIAVVCRYNAALERVRAGLEAGDPNISTTGGDYGTDVFALRDAVRVRWPDRFRGTS